MRRRSKPTLSAWAQFGHFGLPHRSAHLGQQTLLVRPGVPFNTSQLEAWSPRNTGLI